MDEVVYIVDYIVASQLLAADDELYANRQFKIYSVTIYLRKIHL